MENIDSQYKLVVGMFDTMHEAKKAIEILHEHGFPISRVSVITQGLENKSPEKEQAKTSQNRILNRVLDNRFIEKHFPRLIEHFYTGKFFLVAAGTADEVARAFGIIVDAKAEVVNHNLDENGGGKGRQSEPEN